MTKQPCCSRCGQPVAGGHNRRTCGKTPAPPSTVAAPARARRTQGRGKKDEGDALTAGNLETWWNLTNGKTSKNSGTTPPGGEWDKGDTRNLLAMVSAAAEQGISARTLRKFLNRFGVEARTDLAAEPALPLPAIHALAGDTSPSVRRTIAWRGDIPAPVAETLAGDANYSVRAELAANPTTPPPALDIMFDGLEHLPKPQQKSHYSEGLLENRLASHPNSSARIHAHFLTSVFVATAKSAVEHPRTTAGEIEHMVNRWGYYTEVFTAALKHHNTPAHMLAEYCMKHPDHHNICYALENPNIPTSTIEYFYPNPPETSNLFDYYQHRNRVISAIAGNSSTPDSILTEIASGDGHTSWDIVRRARETLSAKHAAGQQEGSPPPASC
jgi:hypothetical protein